MKVLKGRGLDRLGPLKPKDSSHGDTLSVSAEACRTELARVLRHQNLSVRSASLTQRDAACDFSSSSISIALSARIGMLYLLSLR